jgi:hypothetical protein
MESGMEHKAVALKERTKSFARRILIIKLIRALPPGPESRIEADQSAFWLELFSDAQLIPEARLRDLRSEANQLLTIINPSRTTARRGFQSTIKKSTINN